MRLVNTIFSGVGDPAKSGSSGVYDPAKAGFSGVADSARANTLKTPGLAGSPTPLKSALAGYLPAKKCGLAGSATPLKLV